MVTYADAAPPRLWLVFFSDGEGSATWWSRWLRPGFSHVSAAAWYGDVERWVFVNPARQGLIVEVWREEEFGRRLGQLLEDSGAILRVPVVGQRKRPPASWFCVGCISALLGVHTRALSPYQLYRHLVSNGAEIVDTREYGSTFQDSEAAAGRSGGDAASP